MIEFFDINYDLIKFKTKNKLVLEKLEPLSDDEFYYCFISEWLITILLDSFSNNISFVDKERLKLLRETLAEKPKVIYKNSRLFNYQLDAVNLFLQKKNHFLFWEMQTGKTATAVCIASQFKKSLIVVQKGFTEKWKNECLYFGSINKNIIRELTSKNKLNEKKELLKWFINSNEAVFIVEKTALLTVLKNYFYDDIFKLKCDLLIIDEAHLLRNKTTKQSKVLKSLRKVSNSFLGLTATPNVNKIDDVLQLISFGFPNTKTRMIGNYFFQTVYNRFSRHNEFGELKYTKHKEFASFLNKYGTNIKQPKELKDSVKRVIVNINFGQKQLEQYLLAEHDYTYTDSDNETVYMDHTFSIITKLCQICLSPQIINKNFNPNYECKWYWLKNYIEKHNKEQIIIFGVYRSYIELLYERLKKLNIKVACLTGTTKNRFEIVNKFQNKEIQILLANIQVGGTGWTLNNADTIIFVQRDWTPAMNEQAEARFLAKGGSKNKTIIDLIVKDKNIDLNIEEYILNSINKKLDKFEIINNFQKALMNIKNKN